MANQQDELSTEALDAILDMQTQDMKDLPSIEAWETGTYTAIFAGIAPKKVNGHVAVELSFTFLGVVELADESKECALDERSRTSTLFMLDNEIGAGKLKKLQREASGHFASGDGTFSTRQWKEHVVGSEVTITVKKTGKESDDRRYQDVVSIIYST